MTRLAVGDEAPDFALPDQDGQVVQLSEVLAKGRCFVYFYPKADTPGCTVQAQELTKVLGDIGGTAVLGISPDPPRRLKRFQDKCEIGFPLLGDDDHATCIAYDVWKEKSMYGKKYMGVERSAFLVDEKGKLAGVWYKVSPKDTPLRLLEALAG